MIMKEMNVTVISEGIAYGKIVNIKNDNLFVSNRKANNIDYEKKAIKDSFELVIKDLEELKKTSDDEFLTVHIMILKDPALIKEVYFEIDNNYYEASKAFDIVINRYIKQFESSNSFYLEETNLDFKDIRRRVLKALNNDYYQISSMNVIKSFD